ncbi:transmembrane protein 59-like [Atheta coriaria]|uniref:transmembrane protein 59-like n=1 Tax=Dalotia coriaria TaxID=877792 RepID=UPI0031F458DE
MFALVVIVALVGCTLAQNAVNNDHKNLDNNEINSSGNDMEQCQAVCVDIFFLLPDDPLAMSACQRGCRIFNIIYLRDDRNLNNSKDECYSSCVDAYSQLDLNTACRKGCKNMLRKKQSELEAVIVYIEQDTKNLDNPQPELDELEMTWFIENYAPRELHYVDGQRDYKIPESMYRTLPIETLFEELTKPMNPPPSGDWLDCASRNSGIPKWILVSAIISAILVALYLSISSEKKVISDDLLIGDDEDDQGEEKEKEAEPLPAKVPLLELDEQKHDNEAQDGRQDVLFSTPPTAPPKYTIENEKV